MGIVYGNKGSHNNSIVFQNRCPNTWKENLLLVNSNDHNKTENVFSVKYFLISETG